MLEFELPLLLLLNTPLLLNPSECTCLHARYALSFVCTASCRSVCPFIHVLLPLLLAVTEFEAAAAAAVTIVGADPSGR